MKSLDENRSLEEVVEGLLKDDELDNFRDPIKKAKIKIQRLRGELCRYLNRPEINRRQVAYLKNKIVELEDHYPEAKIVNSDRKYD
ncbi:MAG: hypothetical protein PHN69_06035 [Candidatus Pacebacteria bacterium]|nr:hypothetical protein [Candidatus Paceibacterota bacterium]